MKKIVIALFFAFFLFPQISFAMETFGKLTLEGFIDMGFHLKNVTDDKAQDFGFTLNEIEFAIEHKFSEKVSTRWAINYTSNLSELSGKGIFDGLIQEAFISVQLPYKRSRKQQKSAFYLTIGRFYAPQGWDAVNGNLRFQATASLANEYTPNTFLGGKLGWKNSFADISLIVTNGWDLIEDFDSTPSIAFASSFSFQLVSFGVSFIHGKEKSAFKEKLQQTPASMLDAQITCSLLQERLLIGVEGTINFASIDRYWYLILASIHYMPIKWIGFTTRFSRLSDPHELLVNESLNEFSVSLISKPFTPMTIFLEYRLDISETTQSHNIFFKIIYHLERKAH